MQSKLELLEHAKTGNDPGIAFHTGRGAEVVGVVPGWRPDDADNEGGLSIFARTLSTVPRN